MSSKVDLSLYFGTPRSSVALCPKDPEATLESTDIQEVCKIRAASQMNPVKLVGFLS